MPLFSLHFLPPSSGFPGAEGWGGGRGVIVATTAAEALTPWLPWELPAACSLATCCSTGRLGLTHHPPDLVEGHSPGKLWLSLLLSLSSGYFHPPHTHSGIFYSSHFTCTTDQGPPCTSTGDQYPDSVCEVLDHLTDLPLIT